MTSGEAWLKYGDMCESWQWHDWAVCAMFVALCVFGLWKAFTNPALREPPPSGGRDWWN